MLSTDSPARLPIPWANGAAGAYIRTIPVASQIGIQDGAASLTDGFVPDNFTPVAAGGVPPFGQDFNGVLNWLSSIDRWTQAGGAWTFDAAFAAAIGGYPKGAVLGSAIVPGKRWVTMVDGNTTDPDSPLAANWATPPGMFPSGTPVPSLSSTVPNGFVAANGQTIGDAVSGASTQSAATAFLFAAIWAQFSNIRCPVYDSSGNLVPRGANPSADFAAHRRIMTPDMRGVAMVGCDTMGGTATTFLAGVPVTTGNAITPGSILGENLHTLTAGETPTITSTNPAQSIRVSSTRNDVVLSAVYGNTTPGGAFPFTSCGGQNSLDSAGTNAISVSSNNTGGGSHNTVSRSFTVYWNLAL